MEHEADKRRAEERKTLDRYREAGYPWALAICDPGAVVGKKRGPTWRLDDEDAYSEDQESVTEWQTRAVLALAVKMTNSTVTQVADQMDAVHATKMAELQGQLEKAREDEKAARQELAETFRKTAAWRQDFIQLNQHVKKETQRADKLRATLLAVVSTFTESGHPGYQARRSGWISTDHLDEWRAVLAEHGAESPVAHQTTQEATAALKPMVDGVKESQSYLGRQEVLDEVRHLTSVVEALRDEWRTASRPTTPPNHQVIPMVNCTACGATDEQCREIIANTSADRSCCARCKSTDTHPHVRRDH